MLFICGRGKDDHLTGASTAPKLDDPNFKAWKAENSMVMAWLISSMTIEIGEIFLLYTTAKEIWDAARDMYFSNDNTLELFAIESTLHDLRHGQLSVTAYYNLLTRYWQQLDLYEVHTWKCSEDRAKVQRMVETKRVFKFLMGLNKDLDEVRGRILGIKPLPPIRVVFSEVRREESRKKVMMGISPSNPQGDRSALAARGPSYHSTNSRQRGNHSAFNENRPKSGRPWCDHCSKPGHTRDTCWKLVDWKPK
ncbi:uncharacterized protein LOC129884238 [Solanum dulcamara]|uniref:uncharacterized protein LOC129884238 n=1 Tax=Solanum dulcamara TaxID=45834 RepID=UPI002485C53B|nr:uncharacterized protein LOC129884238 [Solanum dulcamara]